jgi:hypothetical protein
VLERVSNIIRTAAKLLSREAFAEPSDYSYQNSGTYFSPFSPSDPGCDIVPGPLSVYNDLEPKNDRFKVVEDIRRQGPSPTPIDNLDYSISPTSVTVVEDPKTDAQGQSSNNVLGLGMGDAWEQLNGDTWRTEGPGGQLVQ